jgi:hypothetical protein
MGEWAASVLGQKVQHNMLFVMKIVTGSDIMTINKKTPCSAV